MIDYLPERVIRSSDSLSRYFYHEMYRGIQLGHLAYVIAMSFE